jgi:hypothetical protein
LNETLTVLEGLCSLVDYVSARPVLKRGSALQEKYGQYWVKIEEVLNGFSLAALVERQKEKTGKMF